MRPSPTTAAIVVCAAIFGVNAVAIKIALESAETLTLLVLRSAITIALMALILRRARAAIIAIPPGSAGRVLTASGLMAISQLTFVLSIFLLPAGLVVMLTSAQPMIAMFVGALMAGERITTLGVVGAALGAGGVVLASIGSLGGDDTEAWGIAVLFFSNTLFAVASAVLKGFQIPHPGERFLLWSSALAGVGALPFALWLERFTIEWRPSFPLALAYTSVIGSAVGLLLMTYALRRGGVFVASLVALLTPAFGIFAASVLLDEAITWEQLLGGAIIVAGVTLALRRPRGSRAARPAG